VRGGDGVRMCMHEMRSCIWSVVLLWTTFCYKLMSQIHRSGILTQIKNYSVRQAYHLLTHAIRIALDVHKDVIWKKIAPLKVSLCMAVVK
jgi:hypothetical protein